MPKIGRTFKQEGLELTFPSSRTAIGSDVSYVSGVWTIKDRSGREAVAKCIYIPSGIAGTIGVHFKDDYNSSEVKQYSILSVAASTVVPCVIDEIKQSTTSISLTNVIFGLSGTEV